MNALLQRTPTWTSKTFDLMFRRRCPNICRSIPSVRLNRHGAPSLARTHMNHGGGDPTVHGATPPPPSGPKQPHLDLGFSAAKHTGNILRLLESSHGTFFYNTVDSLSTVWHSKSQSWTCSDSSWIAANPIQALYEKESRTHHHHHHASLAATRLCTMNFSDDRTALIKIVGQDGRFRYLQLLRLDGDAGSVASGAMTMLPNDGWVILQEVIVATDPCSPVDASSWRSLQSAIFTYLDIEHGGGIESYETARGLFHPDSNIQAVGIDDIDATPTQWTAPVGSLVTIPLSAYLDGVQSQTPHSESVKSQDAIVTIDYTRGANAAAATVRVGNGAQTLVFEDHLLLGRNPNSPSGGWYILSKTFSSQAWPLS